MAPKDLNYFENHYYVFNRRLLRLVGLWPYQKESKRAIRVRLINLTLIIYFIEVCLTLRMDLSIVWMFDLVPILLCVTCFSVCYNNLIHNFTTVTAMFDRIRSDWTDLIDQQKVMVMRKYARENRQFTLIITAVFYITSATLVIPSIIRAVLNVSGIIEDAQLTLPIHIDYMLRKKSYYYFMLWFQVSSIFLGTTIGIVHYSTYITFIEHSYALCNIMMLQLNRPLKTNPSDSCSTNKKHSEEYYWIVDAVRCYNNLTSFVDLINVIYRKTYLVEVSTALLFIITDYFCFFELISASGNINKILACCVYIFASITLTYTICYFGQRFLNYNGDIYIKCCQIPFYALSVKTQKALLLLIMKSMRPCGFSMRGMMILSHELFANIMRTSVSCATVFYNLR